MRIRPGIILSIIAVFGVLFAGRYLGWFGGKSGDVVVASTPEPSEKRQGPIEIEPPVDRPAARTAMTAPTTPVPAVAVVDPNVKITDWEQKIDDVLTGQDDEGLKAKQLMAIFDRLPEDGQVEAIQHISNLLPDEQYADLAKRLTNPATPEGVLEVLMTDVLNRPNQLKLDTLFDVARQMNHPKAEEARDVLEVFLDEVDWDAVKASGNWEPVRTGIDQFMKENPDDPAEPDQK